MSVSSYVNMKRRETLKIIRSFPSIMSTPLEPNDFSFSTIKSILTSHMFHSLREIKILTKALSNSELRSHLITQYKLNTESVNRLFCIWSSFLYFNSFSKGNEIISYNTEANRIMLLLKGKIETIIPIMYATSISGYDFYTHICNLYEKRTISKAKNLHNDLLLSLTLDANYKDGFCIGNIIHMNINTIKANVFLLLFKQFIINKKEKLLTTSTSSSTTSSLSFSKANDNMYFIFKCIEKLFHVAHIDIHNIHDVLNIDVEFTFKNYERIYDDINHKLNSLSREIEIQYEPLIDMNKLYEVNLFKYVSKYNEVIENEEAIFLGKSNNNVYKESVLCVSDECFVLSISHEMFYQYIHIEKEAIYKKHFEYLMNNVLFNGMTMNVNKFKKDFYMKNLIEHEIECKRNDTITFNNYIYIIKEGEVQLSTSNSKELLMQLKVKKEMKEKNITMIKTNNNNNNGKNNDNNVLSYTKVKLVDLKQNDFFGLICYNYNIDISLINVKIISNNAVLYCVNTMLYEKFLKEENALTVNVQNILDKKYNTLISLLTNINNLYNKHNTNNNQSTSHNTSSQKNTNSTINKNATTDKNITPYTQQVIQSVGTKNMNYINITETIYKSYKASLMINNDNKKVPQFTRRMCINDINKYNYNSHNNNNYYRSEIGSIHNSNLSNVQSGSFHSSNIVSNSLNLTRNKQTLPRTKKTFTTIFNHTKLKLFKKRVHPTDNTKTLSFNYSHGKIRTKLSPPNKIQDEINSNTTKGNKHKQIPNKQILSHYSPPTSTLFEERLLLRLKQSNAFIPCYSNNDKDKNNNNYKIQNNNQQIPFSKRRIKTASLTSFTQYNLTPSNIQTPIKSNKYIHKSSKSIISSYINTKLFHKIKSFKRLTVPTISKQIPHIKNSSNKTTSVFHSLHNDSNDYDELITTTNTNSKRIYHNNNKHSKHKQYKYITSLSNNNTIQKYNTHI